MYVKLMSGTMNFAIADVVYVCACLCSLIQLGLHV